jgi:glycosyltransferase involved in cell wall biosynthesis
MNVLSYVHLRNIYGSTGAGRVARQLTEHMAGLDQVNLHVLADAGDHRDILPKVGLPWTLFPYHLFGDDTSKQQARWLLTHRPPAEQYWPEVQIVHCTMESYVPARRCRLVATVHDAAYFERQAHAQSWSTLQQRWKWRILYATLSRKADLFHTVSNFSADRLATFFPSIRTRLRVVHNAAPPRFFEPVSATGEECLEQTGLKDVPFIMLPGGLHFRKNALLVLDAWPRLREKFPDLLLVVVGHSEMSFIERARAFGSIRLLGFVNDEALCSLYHAARVVWFPSKYEGFGIPVVEAMACGAPVVASNCSSLPEVAGDAAILVAPDEASAHVEALEAVLKDSRIRDSLCERGRLRSRNFTWAASAATLRRHFLDLL